MDPSKLERQILILMQYGLGVKMTIYETILATYPELEGSHLFINGTIHIQDDSDGKGAYLKAWNYSEPLPEGLKVGK